MVVALKDILILKALKGNEIAIVNTKNYKNKMIKIVTEGPQETVKGNPMNRTVKLVHRQVKKAISDEKKTKTTTSAKNISSPVNLQEKSTAQIHCKYDRVSDILSRRKFGRSIKNTNREDIVSHRKFNTFYRKKQQLSGKKKRVWSVSM